MEFETAPGYDGQPVILQHLVLDDSPNVAFCAPIKILPVRTPTSAPVILCPACHIALGDKAVGHATRPTT